MKRALQAAAFSAAFTLGWLASPLPGPIELGISKAEAAEFYTRKRVNGRWITGKFRRKGTQVADASDVIPPPVAPPPTTTRSAVPPPVAAPVAAAVATPFAAAFEARPSGDEGQLAALKRALEQRAASMAKSVSNALTQTGNVLMGPVQAAPQRTVSKRFDDYVQGVTTLVYSDGTMEEYALGQAPTR